jgi:hypothetical protein
MERRGAREVVAIDLGDNAAADKTVGATGWGGEESRQSRAFALAHRLLGSKVEWHDMSVYDANPERLGTFDFVFIGSLLIHLRDPIGALAAVRTVVGGQLLSFEPVAPILSILHPAMPAARFVGLQGANWWFPNTVGYRRWIQAGGFRIDKAGGIAFIRRRRSRETTNLRLMLRHPFQAGLLGTLGIPQTWVLATPER